MQKLLRGSDNRNPSPRAPLVVLSLLAGAVVMVVWILATNALAAGLPDEPASGVVPPAIDHDRVR